MCLIYLDKLIKKMKNKKKIIININFEFFFFFIKILNYFFNKILYKGKINDALLVSKVLYFIKLILFCNYKWH